MRLLVVFTVFFCFMFQLAAEQPVFRAGIFTDTHVTEKKESFEALKKALVFFKNQKVDLVINLGDIAHSYSPEAYRLYRETSNEVFADLAKSPHEIFAFANHDWIGRKSEPFYDVYKDVKNISEPHMIHVILRLQRGRDNGFA